MNPMMAAIKKRKAGGLAVEGDHQDMGHDSAHSDDKQKDLHGLVASLSDGEKHKLKSILSNDSGDKSQAIAKGGPSSQEDAKVKSAIDDENNETALQEREEQAPGAPGHDSDDIALSMLDSRHLGGNPPEGKPRNLGERMKMSLAAKLKGKGKI